MSIGANTKLQKRRIVIGKNWKYEKSVQGVKALFRDFNFRFNTTALDLP